MQSGKRNLLAKSPPWVDARFKFWKIQHLPFFSVVLVSHWSFGIFQTIPLLGGHVQAFISGFLNLSTVEIWAQIILGLGGCPGLCRILSSMAGLHSPEARSNPATQTHTHTPSPVVTTRSVPRLYQISPGGAKLPLVENSWFM